MNIKLTKSLIFDAVCTCSFLAGQESNLNPTQKNVIDILKPRANGRIADEIMSYSTLCLIISEYISDPEKATLDDLCNMFESITEVDMVVRPKIKGEFVQSFIYQALDMLKGGLAEQYCKHISVLKEIGFEEVWYDYIAPNEDEQINIVTSQFSNFDIDGVLKTVSSLKCNSVDNVKIYISVMSYPVAFALNESSFLDTIGGEDRFISIIAHELMHGFASDELIGIYKSFVNSSLYLKSTHHYLINNMHSGCEEEFVMAAERYIMYKCRIMTKEEIVLSNYSTYGGSVPLSMYIFEYLTREEGEIVNYDRWLVEKYKSGAFKPEEIFDVIDSSLPSPVGIDNFYANYFTAIQRCAYIIKWSQMHDQSDIKEKIENLTNEKFSSVENRVLSFANGTVELSDIAKREALKKGNMTIERIEFANKKDALSLKFSHFGSNVGPMPIEYDGEVYGNSYCLNLAFSNDKSIQAEFYFVCNNAKYLITSCCDESIKNLEGENGDDLTFSQYGKEIMKAVSDAVDIVMLLNEQ